jgi:Ion channel
MSQKSRGSQNRDTDTPTIDVWAAVRSDILRYVFITTESGLCFYAFTLAASSPWIAVACGTLVVALAQWALVYDLKQLIRHDALIAVNVERGPVSKNDLTVIAENSLWSQQHFQYAILELIGILIAFTPIYIALGLESKDGIERGLWECLYFSIMTFTTVGTDLQATGLARPFSALEVMLGYCDFVFLTGFTSSVLLSRARVFALSRHWSEHTKH